MIRLLCLMLPDDVPGLYWHVTDESQVKAELVGFGEIEVEGRRYDFDVVIDEGEVRKRKKKSSKAHRGRFGHTPLSAEEAIPWGGRQLIVGTGFSGQLPIMDEVYEEARKRGIEVVALPTREACDLLGGLEPRDVRAVLHTTC